MTNEIDIVFRHRANGLGVLLAALRVCAGGVRNYFRHRHTRRVLSHLSDDALKDIGLVRTHSGYRELHQDRLGADYWN